MKIKPLRRYPIIAITAFVSMLLPSIILFNKYLGAKSILLYWAIALILLAVLIAFKDKLFELIAHIPDKVVTVLLILFFVVIVVITVVIYPIANSGKYGYGSDSDDSINAATSALLQGRYPYYAKLYTGQPVSQFPGAIILALPWVAVFGHAAYQNVFGLSCSSWSSVSRFSTATGRHYCC